MKETPKNTKKFYEILELLSERMSFKEQPSSLQILHIIQSQLL